jgi:hypothetical protein
MTPRPPRPRNRGRRAAPLRRIEPAYAGNMSGRFQGRGSGPLEPCIGSAAAGVEKGGHPASSQGARLGDNPSLRPGWAP